MKARQPCHETNRRRRTGGFHTGTAKGIDDLICLLLVIEVPSLFERTRRLGSRALLFLAEFQAIEDEDTADTKVLQDLEFLLDVRSEGERESAQCA